MSDMKNLNNWLLYFKTITWKKLIRDEELYSIYKDKLWIQDKETIKRIIRKLIERWELVRTINMWEYFINLEKNTSIIENLDNYLSWTKYYFWWMQLYNLFWLTKQIANVYDIYISKRVTNKERILFWNKLRFHYIQNDKYFLWIKKIKIWNNNQINVLSNERLIIEVLINSWKMLQLDEISYFLKNITFSKKELIKLWLQMWLNIFRRVIFFLKLRNYNIETKYINLIQKNTSKYNILNFINWLSPRMKYSIDKDTQVRYSYLEDFNDFYIFNDKI